MSLQLISRSPDLKRLRDDGYDIEVKSNHLLVRDVPYVDAQRKVMRGVLVSVLELDVDVTKNPVDNHVVMFIGDLPCLSNGTRYEKIICSSSPHQIDRDLTAHFQFSSKPGHGRKYRDYYEKMTTYAEILTSEACAIDPDVSPRTFPPVRPDPDESVFNYMDTASSRAGITSVSQKLELAKVAIVGLGGTGAYILDQVAKTPVKEIHIFDGDTFSSHNAFRCPGAPSFDELKARPKKVPYLHAMYSKMHRHVVAHDHYIDDANVHELRGMSFVFVCVDRGAPKRVIVDKLEEFGTPFIEVGMGVYLRPAGLVGALSTTTSTPAKRDHLGSRIVFGSPDENNVYSTNIQVADLNALHAAFAVLKWKKIFGFYADLEHEHFSTYNIDGNNIVNDDRAE